MLGAYADWAHELPDDMASSMLLLRYPDAADVAPELRGRYVSHLRVADSGDDHRER